MTTTTMEDLKAEARDVANSARTFGVRSELVQRAAGSVLHRLMDFEQEHYPEPAPKRFRSRGLPRLRRPFPKRNSPEWVTRAGLSSLRDILSSIASGQQPTLRVEDVLGRLKPAVLPEPPALNKNERKIVDALRASGKAMTNEKLLNAAGLNVNSGNKTVLASLRKRGIILNDDDHKGYHLPEWSGTKIVIGPGLTTG